MPCPLIQVFTKSPVVGTVKTRLTPPLSPEEARQLHVELIRNTISVSQESKTIIQLWTTPPTDHPILTQYEPEIEVFQQFNGNLGDRMLDALTQGLHGHDKVILLGTDCPGITSERIHSAFRALENHDCVINPVEDGGFSMIGVRQISPKIFSNIFWSSESVMKQMRVNLSELQWSWLELPTLYDVDTPADYARLTNEDERFIVTKKKLRHS